MKQMNRESNSIQVAAILSISLLTVMAPTAVSPAISSIKDAFPNISNEAAKYVLTLPSLIMIPFSLFSGWLTNRMNVKHILYLGMILYVVLGISGGLVNNFTSLLVIRALFGISIGLLMPLSNSLIFDFISPSQRGKVLGWSGSANQFGGIMFSLASGLLAAYSWRYSFGVYIVALLPLFLVIIGLPSIPSRKKTRKENSGKTHLGPKLFILAFLSMMSSVTFFVVNTDLALFIQEEKNVFSTATPLLESREVLEKLIQQEQVNEAMIDNFSKNGITIDSSYKIKEDIPHQEWRVYNEDKEYRVEKNGNELVVLTSLGTSEMAGYALSLRGIPSVIAGLILAWLLRRMKYYLIPAAALCMGLGYYLLGLSSSYAMVLIAVSLIGLAGGLITPPLILLVPRTVNSTSLTLAMAVISSSALLGQFVSPLYTQLFSVLFHNDTFRFKFFVITVTLTVLALGGLIYIITHQEKQQGDHE